MRAIQFTGTLILFYKAVLHACLTPDPFLPGFLEQKQFRVARLRSVYFRGSEAGLDGAGVGDDGSVLRGILDFWGRGW